MIKDILFSHKRKNVVYVVILHMDVELSNKIGLLMGNMLGNKDLLIHFMINGLKKIFQMLFIGSPVIKIKYQENSQKIIILISLIIYHIPL